MYRLTDPLSYSEDLIVKINLIKSSQGNKFSKQYFRA